MSNVEYPRINNMVDVALFTLYEKRLCVALLPRNQTADSSTPYEGMLALPGAYIRPQVDTSTDDTARRLLREKAAILPPHLEQLYSFNGLLRDPRGWSVCTAYYGASPYSNFLQQGESKLQFVPVENVPELPFDHNRIVNMAVARLRSKSTYSTLPMFLLPEEFTINELHKTYEHVMGIEIPMVTFRRKIEAQEIIKPIEGRVKTGKHRPAQLFARTDNVLKMFDENL